MKVKRATLMLLLVCTFAIGGALWFYLEPQTQTSGAIQSSAVIPKAFLEAANETESDSQPRNVKDSDRAHERAQTTHRLLALAAVDPLAAIEAAKREFPGEGLQKFISFLGQETCRVDLTKIDAFLDNLPSLYDQKCVTEVAGAGVARRDVDELIAGAAAASSPLRKGLLLGAGLRAMVGDGNLDAARKIFSEMPYSEARLDAIRVLAEGLGKESAKMAIAWIGTLDVPADRAAAVRALAFSAAASRSVDTLQLIRESTTDTAMIALIDRQLGNLGAASSSSPELQQAYSIGVAPIEEFNAVASKLTTFKETEARAVATDLYTKRLFAISDRRAADFAISAPAAIRPIALRSITEAWHDADSMALSQWANSLPAGNARDLVLFTMVEKLAHSDRDAARQIASAIADASLRKRAVARAR